MATLVKQCSTYFWVSGSNTPNSSNDGRGWWDIYYEQSASDKALNRTKVIVYHKAQFVGNALYGQSHLHANFNGGGLSFVGSINPAGSAGWYTVKTTTHYVYHNSSGKGSFTFQGAFVYDSAFKYTNWETIPLPTIPKQSTVTATNANIGSASSININRASSSYTHKLYYKFTGQADYTLMAENIDTSYGWTVPTSVYALIPNAKEISCTIKCETYNGATLVGTPTTTTMKAYVDENASRPEITNLNGSTGLSNPLTGNPLAIIKYISSFSIWGDLSSKNSAKLKSISVTSGDGKSVLVDLTSENTDEISLSYYTTQLLLQNLESNIFTITLTDSRNISKVYNLPSVEIPTTLVPYIKLTLNPAFYRTSPTNNEIAVIFDGNYFNGNFGAVNNTLEVKYRYRELGEETWSEYYSLTPIIDGNKYTNGSVPIVLEQVFDYQKQYYFQFIAQDKIYTGNEIGGQTIVSRGIPNHWWNENTFNVEKDLIVQGSSYLQSAYIKGNKVLDTSNIVQTFTADTDKVPSADFLFTIAAAISTEIADITTKELLWSGSWAGNGTSEITLSDNIYNYKSLVILGNRTITCSIISGETVINGIGGFVSATPAIIIYGLEATITADNKLKMVSARSYNLNSSAYGVYTATAIYGIK